LNNLLVDTYIG